MAEHKDLDFNRSALTIRSDKVVCYTGQRAEKIPCGLFGIVGCNCVGLDLSFNELKSVSSVKNFTQLEELILDNNDLKDLKSLPIMPHLSTLSLNNNKFTDIYSVLQKIRDCCPKIGYVSLLGNPGCPDQLTDPTLNDEDDYERYRLYAIYTLPQTLRFLDSRPVSFQERNEAQNRGQYLKTVKVPERSSSPNCFDTLTVGEFDEAIFNVNYTPLPRTTRGPYDHKGAYGKCRYRYSGKNSEGNRFISNNDL
ncbi:leucine-rich melanocyte differentiation-associated protein-like isoform X1 [Leptopilina heterotoma]|uniref:leucine-rich melanocyte differentiation-associated protein-like isoform X1 n=1 Tax=Leptopilina heterotoma TaxID=63436 RepID=UPI001CA97505|nr:leucine-rich melanocyte differentiation-associated protein-like isoform X1 [Leptopilina heterotoma]